MVPQLRRKNGVPQFFPQVKEFFRQRDVLSLVMQKETASRSNGCQSFSSTTQVVQRPAHSERTYTLYLLVLALQSTSPVCLTFWAQPIINN